ncbi:putative aldouronate transport system substrate-binding protein [Cohnella sp. OV330]|uniref:extracellular solute-binding protein n=1 Tax=Cohnella sp. OV330 TaxID=1855288 RepID=UPI0008ED68BF|nr:extracellular solute-binding protein [Cohnella sp. OV330]SFA81951.1 putative aldouronate transport system substrate-binding protein [Cohnella sp. OV330]
MKNNQRMALLSGILASAIAATGCSDGGNNAASAEPSGKATGSAATSGQSSATTGNGDPFGKYDPPIELHIARAVDQAWTYPQGDSIDDNVWYREYEKLLGVKIVHDWTALTGEYNRKLNVSIASGSLPEVFSVSASQLKQLADAGQLEDLTDVYEKYASDHTKKLQAGDGGAALASATFNGKLLAIPVVNAPFFESNLLWVRTDWLEKLNLSEPKALDDVFKISEAFTKQDPDGNGKDDTYGLAVNNYLYGPITSITGLSNAYHAYPQTWLKDVSGKVVYGSTQPEMKQTLAKLQEMYKAGQLDREFGVKDSNKVAEDIAAGKFGMAFGAFWNPAVLVDAVRKNPGMEWKSYAVSAVDGALVKANVGFSASGYTVVRKGAKHPEAVVKMLNLFEELVHGSRRDEGQFITVVENGNSINTSRLAVVQSGVSNEGAIDSIDLLRQAVNNEDVSILKDAVTATDFYQPTVDYRKDKKIENWTMAHQFQGLEVLLDNYTGDRLLMTAFGGQTPTMTEKWATLDKLEKEIFTKIVMGAASVDEFDTFVADWNKLGGADILKEINEWLDSQKG